LGAVLAQEIDLLAALLFRILPGSLHLLQLLARELQIPLHIGITSNEPGG